MGNDKCVAAIDTDFINKFTKEGRDTDFFIEVMDSLNVEPVMHKYVYEDELMENSGVRHLVETQKIKIIDYEDFLKGDEMLYEETFKHLYSILNGKEFDDTYGNIFEYSKAEESLGEIRTILMAFYLGIGMFFSDDSDSKDIVEKHFSQARNRISVYNVLDTFIKLKGVNAFTWKKVKGFAKSMLSKRKYDKLNEIWHT